MIDRPPQGFGPPGGFPGFNLGDVGNKILDLLDAPRTGVQNVASGILSGGTQDREMIEEWKRGNARAWESINPWPLQALSNVTGVTPYDLALGIGGQAFDIATDPLTYVGLGLPARGAKLAQAAGRAAPAIAPAAERAAQLLQIAQRADDLPSRVLSSLFRGAPVESTAGADAGIVPRLVGAVNEALPEGVQTAINPAKWVRPMVATQEGKGVRRANDILDALRSRSKESSFARDTERFNAAAEYAIRSRYNIYRSLADDKAIRDAKAADPAAILSALTGDYDPQKFMTGKTLMQGYNQEFIRRYAEAPNAIAKMAVLEMARDLDVMNKGVWEAAYGVFNQARGTAPKAGSRAAGVGRRDESRAMYAQAMEQIRLNSKAALDALADEMPRYADIALDPTMEQTLLAEVNKTANQMMRARQTASEGVFPIKQVERTDPATKVKYQGRMSGDTEGRRFRDLEDRVAQEDALMDHLQDFVRTQLAGGQRAVDPARMLAMMDQRKAELMDLVQGGTGFGARVPSEMGGTARDAWSQVIKSAQQAANNLNAYEDAFGTVFEKLLPGQTYQRLGGLAANPAVQQRDAVLRHINQNMDLLAQSGAIKPTAINNQQELFDFVRPYVDSKTFNDLQRRAGEFMGVDLLENHPIAAAVDKASRQLMPLYGIEPASKAGMKALLGARTVYQTLNALFKDQALASFSYPVVNAMGALFNHTLMGMDPISGFKLAMQGAVRAVLDPKKYHPTSGVQDLMKMTGEVPYGAARGFAAQISETQDAWKRLPGGQATLAGLGALGGAAGGAAKLPEDATPEEKAAGVLGGAALGAAGLGVAYPAMSKLVHRLARGVEDAIRGAEWEYQFRNTHLENAPRYEQIAQDAMGAPRVKTETTAATRTTADPQQATTLKWASQADQDDVIDFIKSQDHYLTPEAFGQLLAERGATPAARQKAVKAWRDLNHEANMAGQKLAAETQFDYKDLNNLEEFMKEFAPFSTYVMKANPFFARHLVEKPVIAVTLGHLLEQADKDRRESGLTSRVSGAFNFSGPDQFWATLLGYPAMAFYNPIRGMFPWANVLRSGEPREGENPYEAALRTADILGLPTPSPFLQGIARVAGAQGEAPPQNLIRMAGPIQGLTGMAGLNRGRGIDIGAGLGAGERAVRTALGQEVADPEASAAMNRLDEMYLRATGKTIGTGGDPTVVPFETAKAFQSGPLWDEAIRQVSRERGARSIAGFIASPLAPQTFVSPEEAEIRGARAQTKIFDPAFTRQLQQAAYRNPTAQASNEALAAVQDASLYFMKQTYDVDGLPPAVAERLQSGTNADLHFLVSQMRDKQSEMNPLLEGYGQSGSSQTARIQALLGLKSDLPLAHPGGGVIKQFQEQAATAGYGQPKPRVPAILQPTAARIKGQREGIDAMFPVLARYKGWKDANPNGTVADFLEWAKKNPE